MARAAYRAAQQALSAADPVMAALIERVGPCRLVVKRRASPYEALAHAVAHQQLHAAAANAMLKRLSMLGGDGENLPQAAQLLAMGDQELRGCGFSRAKMAALRDIAARTLDGTVPNRRALQRLDDAAVIERLTQLRGVGPWTVEMLLIFTLGRPDVLPANDYGVRNGFRRAYGLTDLPTPRALAEHGQRWQPWRSIAAWYLWRAVELPAEQFGANS
ncbi:MAG: DNA-3-methyladenine glycosylase 2 family protein [Rhodocyclaceae bacterium]|nr:DNA-3-methyladenine glycosylase 2 family protein [Rhodocyclaceae bacterium]MBX3670895.1 DNA-3-methyladenine glycosylase 2 family protein [Rhodocyclaceae bacterium]